jgi:hypothetical protein
MSSSLPPLPSVDPAFASRLVTLADGRPGLRGGIHVEIREPAAPSDPQPSTQKPSAILDFIASDETLDRYDETISAAGWQLANYLKNPVFQNAHKYGDIIFTLGRALITEVRGGKLFQQVEFATDVNPMAKIAYGLYRGKFLNAVSVGFIPLEWENGDGKSSRSVDSLSASGGEGRGEVAASLRNPQSAIRTPQFRRRYTSQELLEVSAVGIPANPNALALGLKSGAIEKSDLKDTLDLLRGFCDSEFKVQMASPGADHRPQTSEFKVQSSKFKVQSSASPP